MNKFIVGLGFGGDHEYTINGVKYIVSSRFEKRGGSTLSNRIGRCVTSDFVSLQPGNGEDIIGTENVCSEAAEGGQNAV